MFAFKALTSAEPFCIFPLRVWAGAKVESLASPTACGANNALTLTLSLWEREFQELTPRSRETSETLSGREELREATRKYLRVVVGERWPVIFSMIECPCSSADRVPASGAGDESSILSGGTTAQAPLSFLRLFRGVAQRQGAWFGSRRSAVQICPPRPSLSLSLPAYRFASASMRFPSLVR